MVNVGCYEREDVQQIPTCWSYGICPILRDI